MAMSYQLPGFSPGGCKTEPVNNIIQAPLQEKEEVFTGNAFHPIGLLKGRAKLFLQDPVNPSYLLLFTELHPVIGHLGPSLSMLAGGIVSSLDGAFVGITTFPLEK
jgi:hypothetical protein